MASLPSSRLGAAMSAAIIISPPPMPEMMSAERMVRGAVLRGFLVSSDSSPAELKPTITYAAIKPETRKAPTAPRSEVVTTLTSATTSGPRCAAENNARMTAATPTISQVTPMEFTWDISFTPRQLITVVSTRRMAPRMTALAAPVGDVNAGSPPTSWKPSHNCGSTTWSAIAAAAAVMTWAIDMNQPANQPTTSPPIRRDHW